VFQKKLAGAAAADKAYGLDSAITYLEAKTKSDFVQPRPSPLVHSNLVSIMEADNVTPTGGKKLVCHDPILKEHCRKQIGINMNDSMTDITVSQLAMLRTQS
jgi:hypothetical protein